MISVVVTGIAFQEYLGEAIWHVDKSRPSLIIYEQYCPFTLYAIDMYFFVVFIENIMKNGAFAPERSKCSIFHVFNSIQK